MPRPPANSPNEIYDALKGFCFIDNKGKLLTWDNDVWKKAVDAMRGKMSKDYIYLYLSKNRNNVFNRIHGIETLESTKDESIDTTADNSRDLNWSMGETNCVLPTLRKSITLSKSEWDTLKSNIVKYKDREYEVIGWSDAVYDILWSHLKLPCPFSFKNAKINRNPSEIFLSIKGSCSECESKIHIYSQSEPTGDSPILNISTFDSRGIVHEKKRQVRGDRRIRIGKELQGTSTYTWRRNEANKLMDFGDVVPANLPSEDVARKAKQEAQDKELGVFKVKAALASVWDIKYGQEFNGCIYEIGLDHFYVMYWTPTQLFLYKKFQREDNSISIDATGGMIKQIPKPDGSRRVVYLYQAVCGYRKKILPLFQLISEKHDTNTLTYWMREWLRSGGSVPKQVVIDYSLALLNATSLAFNNTDLKTYIENCIVFGNSSSSMRVQRPRCLIRIDIAHLIKLVARWSCFKHESPEKKDFYLRCVGLLSTCTKIDKFIEICTDVLSVAFSTYEDIDNKKSHCFAAHNRIINRIKFYHFPNDMPKDPENNGPKLLERCDETLLSSNALDAIMQKIKSDSTNNLKQGRLNPYHCPDFGSRLFKLSKQFVLWTAVMTSSDEQNSTLVKLENKHVASSTRSEEYFRELKHQVFKKGKAIRVDKYLIIHLRSLIGTTKLLNAPEKEIQKDNLPLIKSHEEVVIDDTKKSEHFVDKSIESIIDDTDESHVHNSEDLVTDLVKKVLSQSEDITVDSIRSETSFLNEAENWKGLNKKTNSIKSKTSNRANKRGKYLTACPDIEIIHKRPKFTPMLPILVNGNSLKPINIGKHIISLRNTCAFDSTIQSILAAYHDFEAYSEYLTKNNFFISKFVQTLSTMGVSAKLYNERGRILSTTKEIKDGILDCMINISYLQEKFILRDVPSLKKIARCTDCLFEKSIIMPVLHINPVSIYKYGMAGLQEAVNEACKPSSTSICLRCKSANIMKIFSGGSHMVLDIEDVGNDLLSTRMGYPNCRKQFTIKEIPDKLVYDKYTYKFVSAIIYSDSHYFAFIKRITDKWEIHNDLKERVMKVTARTLLQKHSIHMLFYVRISKKIEIDTSESKSPSLIGAVV